MTFIQDRRQSYTSIKKSYDMKFDNVDTPCKRTQRQTAIHIKVVKLHNGMSNTKFKACVKLFKQVQKTSLYFRPPKHDGLRLVSLGTFHRICNQTGGWKEKKI